LRKSRRQGLDEFHGNGRIVVIRRADLNRTGAGNQEFQHVVDRGNATNADQRRLHRLGHLIDAPQGNRLDRRSGEATHPVAQHRLPLPPVDRHTQHGVDERDRIGAAIGRGFGNFGDACHIGGQLGQDGNGARSANVAHQAVAQARVGAEIDAVSYIRARDIELDRGDPFLTVKLASHGNELVVRSAGDTDNYRGWQFAQIGQMVSNEGVDAVVVQADRIEEAGGRFDRPPGCIARPWLGRHRLGQDAAQTLKIDQMLDLAGVTKRAGRGEYGIAQLQAAESGREVRSGQGRSGRAHPPECIPPRQQRQSPALSPGLADCSRKERRQFDLQPLASYITPPCTR
jgi:hypothetical protein